MLAAQAPVTACHSEFQMAPIFPLMARRSGRQHIGEGGPRRAVCSRGSIREKRGTRGGERRGLEHHASSDVFFYFFFYDYFGDCFLIWGCVAWLIVPSLLLAELLMVELPCPASHPHRTCICSAALKNCDLFLSYKWCYVQMDVLIDDSLKCDYFVSIRFNGR